MRDNYWHIYGKFHTIAKVIAYSAQDLAKKQAWLEDLLK